MKKKSKVAAWRDTGGPRESFLLETRRFGMSREKKSSHGRRAGGHGCEHDTLSRAGRAPRRLRGGCRASGVRGAGRTQRLRLHAVGKGLAGDAERGRDRRAASGNEPSVQCGTTQLTPPGVLPERALGWVSSNGFGHGHGHGHGHGQAAEMAGARCREEYWEWKSKKVASRNTVHFEAF